MPELAPWVAELALYALLLITLVAYLVAKGLTNALFNTLKTVFGPIPGVHSALDAAQSATIAAITGAFYTAEHGIDKAIGWSFHLGAKLWTYAWDEIKRHAGLIATIASFIPGIGSVVAALRALVHTTHRTQTRTAARVKTLEKEYKGIEHQIKHLEKEFHGIDETGIRHHLRTLDKEISTINTQTIPAIRSRVAADEGLFSGLESWLGIKSGINAQTWAIALATTLLGAAGLGGLRCTNFTNLLKRFGCGLGSLLDALLGLAISALALENVCTLLPIAETAFGDVVGPVTHLLTEVPLGGCETPPKGWATLSVASGPLPPPQTLGQLAA